MAARKAKQKPLITLKQKPIKPNKADYIEYDTPSCARDTEIITHEETMKAMNNVLTAFLKSCNLLKKPINLTERTIHNYPSIQVPLNWDDVDFLPDSDKVIVDIHDGKLTFSLADAAQFLFLLSKEPAYANALPQIIVDIYNGNILIAPQIPNFDEESYNIRLREYEDKQAAYDKWESENFELIQKEKMRREDLVAEGKKKKEEQDRIKKAKAAVAKRLKAIEEQLIHDELNSIKTE